MEEIVDWSAILTKTLRLRRTTGSPRIADSKFGTSQRSRSAVLTKRIAASGYENALKSGDPVIVRMLSFIKTEVNVSREVGMLDESLDGSQKS